MFNDHVSFAGPALLFQGDTLNEEDRRAPRGLGKGFDLLNDLFEPVLEGIGGPLECARPPWPLHGFGALVKLEMESPALGFHLELRGTGSDETVKS